MIFISFMMVAVIVSYSSFFKSKENLFPVAFNEYFFCDGKLDSAPIAKETNVKLNVFVKNCRKNKDAQVEISVNKLVRFTCPLKTKELFPGDEIKFRAKFWITSEYKNDGVFSYREYLELHGIAAQGNIYGDVKAEGNSSVIRPWIESLRRETAASIDMAVNSESKSIIKALAIGDQTGVAYELRDVFALSGLAHLLAISGMNVAYVSIFIFFLSRFIFGYFAWLLRRIPLQHISAMVTLPCVWMYVLFTGEAISAIRAGLMITCYLLGLILYERQDLLNTLGTSVVCILFIYPMSVYDVSFQLSVVAVAGIIILSPKLMVKRGIPYLRSLVAVTLAAMIATTPIVAYHFKFASGIGLLANMVAVPFTGAFLSPVVALATVISFISDKSAILFWKISGFTGDIFIEFSKFMAAVGKPLIIRMAPDMSEIFITYALIVLLFFWKKIPYKKTAAISLAAILIFDTGELYINKILNTELEIVFFDVGQGDCAFIKFPNGKTMLIDGGGVKSSTFDIGKNVVAPALLKKGVKKIDQMLLTHPHLDHFGGLAFVASEFGTDTIYTNGLDGPPEDKSDWREFSNKLKEASVKLTSLDEGTTTIKEGSAELKFYKLPYQIGDDFNDSSIVAEIIYKDRHFLFLGDITKAGEEKLKNLYPEITADVLKIAHHGGAGSTSKVLLDSLKPEIAVISVGQNRYGMPDRGVLNLIDDAGIKVLRTDKNGAISIKSDGLNLQTRSIFP